MEDLGEDSSAMAGLAGLHLDAAKLDDMAESLRKLECEKRGLLDEIEVLRKRLAEEKVRDIVLGTSKSEHVDTDCTYVKK